MVQNLVAGADERVKSNEGLDIHDPAMRHATSTLDLFVDIMLQFSNTAICFAMTSKLRLPESKSRNACDTNNIHAQGSNDGINVVAL